MYKYYITICILVCLKSPWLMDRILCVCFRLLYFFVWYKPPHLSDLESILMLYYPFRAHIILLCICLSPSGSLPLATFTSYKTRLLDKSNECVANIASFRRNTLYIPVNLHIPYCTAVPPITITSFAKSYYICLTLRRCIPSFVSLPQK